ncbi:hypothetical protein HJFPF1_08546 [Paramyrothecium foliicola]|nr:hypothetical protein HJFPF1_08546 [Paramyrothecium foliicola]
MHSTRPLAFCGDCDGTNKVKPYSDITSLLRVCRTFYWELLPMLYADNTVSLLGAEMVPYFARNVGLDGLRHVENVHLILILDATTCMSSRSMRKVTNTMSYLMKHYTSLKQSDAEVLITWNQPAEPDKLWHWLIHDAFSALKGLEDFVLKIQVVKPPRHWREMNMPSDQVSTSAWEELKCSCGEEDYQSLRRAATEGVKESRR